jgi:hypothetical protein
MIGDLTRLPINSNHCVGLLQLIIYPNIMIRVEHDLLYKNWRCYMLHPKVMIGPILLFGCDNETKLMTNKPQLLNNVFLC